MILTSYFYQVRWFTPEYVPFSTAVWDPKWFHNNMGNKWVFKDKNGVINGLRCIDLVPGSQLQGLCRGPENCNQLNSCNFLAGYAKQISNVDMKKLEKELIDRAIHAADKLCVSLNAEPIPVLMFFETPDNPCSERVKVIERLHQCKVDTYEWRKYET